MKETHAERKARAAAILTRLEQELQEAEGLGALDKLLDEFVRENLPLIWDKLEQGIMQPYKCSPLLLKLIDKAKASPLAVKLKAEGFRLEVVHRLEKEDDAAPRQIDGVEIVRDSGEKLPLEEPKGNGRG